MISSQIAMKIKKKKFLLMIEFCFKNRRNYYYNRVDLLRLGDVNINCCNIMALKFLMI